ncbi:MAG: GntR family transcriptional regulator [Eubacteriales bacterium]|nr:GntR family transcriptional regulator [Eubacteriales bacterium]
MIKRNSAKAMYEQIYEELKREIAEGKYAVDGSIGTQQELVDRFNVSLVTVRKAIQKLSDEGLVESKQGKGTYVTHRPLTDHLNRLRAMSSVISINKKSAVVEVISIVEVETPAFLSEERRAKIGNRCVRVDRIHSIGAKPVGYSQLFIPLKIGKLLTREKVEHNSTYSLYEKDLKIILGKGIQTISAEQANSSVAMKLQVPAGTPVLKLVRESFAANGMFLELMITYYAYNQYALQVELDLTSE